MAVGTIERIAKKRLQKTNGILSSYPSVNGTTKTTTSSHASFPLHMFDAVCSLSLELVKQALLYPLTGSPAAVGTLNLWVLLR